MTWWLAGEAVPEDERIVTKDATGDSLLNASSSTHNLPLVAGVPMAGGMAATVSDVERATWQQEKQKLYQMLDDKVQSKLLHVEGDILWPKWILYEALTVFQPWLRVKWNNFGTILKLFQCFASRVTTSETEIESFQPPKESWNCFGIISATLNVLGNVHELQ